MTRRIAIIIPAYNEERSIVRLLRDIREAGPFMGYLTDPVIVNDCSTDRTAEMARSTGATVLDLPVNLGIGGAVQTGLRYAWEKDYDFAMQMDGDGQHPPSEVHKLIEAMENSPADIIIGSRFLEKEGFQSTAARRLGIVYFKYLIRLISGITVTDCTSGFRIYNRRSLEVVKDLYPDEYPEPESFILFKKNRLQVREVPVVMHERLTGESSINTFRSVYFLVKVSLATLFSSLKY